MPHTPPLAPWPLSELHPDEAARINALPEAQRDIALRGIKESLAASERARLRRLRTPAPDR